jgi:ectoine hydroxylase-related dioxygenase (phytanoyl-CoA dioxygenase family)
MTILTQEQKDQFWRDGAIVIPNAVTAEELASLRVDFASWVEESKQQIGPFGKMLDGRPRFDVDPDHSADRPSLRRVASPEELSESYHAVTFNSRLADINAELIGPNIRLHHTKVNSKLPKTKTVVKWHQDFPFDPHSNDDGITALLFVDDVTEENGPLRIVPGTHRGPIHSHWQDGIFTGAISDDLVPGFEADAIPCFGPAGSVCLMHTRVAHASSANNSEGPRTLFIVTYTAADALPLAPCAVPSVHAGKIVRGVEPGRIRAVEFDIETPEIPKGASFFNQQENTG